MRRFVSIFSIIIVTGSVAAGEEPDTTDLSHNPAVDSVGMMTPVDSLSPVERAQKAFEARYNQFSSEKKVILPSLSYFDTLTTYFLSSRQNKRAQVDRAYFHDAGDYFRSDPSFFILDHQATPMRKTVQPFGVTGDRLNLFIDGRPVHPFEHVIEPDGLVDLNDIPTATDGAIYTVPGPFGLLVGGEGALASLVTVPRRPDESVPETSILHDKGFSEYNFTRGRYSRVFQGGRTVDAAISYRNAVGLDETRGDDAYNYYGDFYFPIENNTAFRAWGQLYSRTGSFAIRPRVHGAAVNRSKFDRNLRLSLDFHNDDHTRRGEAGFRHVRQGSRVSGNYRTRQDITTNAAFVTREWMAGQRFFQTRLEAVYTTYNTGRDQFYRFETEAMFSLANLQEGFRYAVTGGGKYDEDFKFLPRAAIVLFAESDKMFVSASAGYTERAPSLYEQNLPFQRATIYASSFLNYADGGRSSLLSEKQMVGNVTLELGSPDNNFGIRGTVGKIWDGIDWREEKISDNTGEYTLFRPANGDLEFADISIGPKLKYNDYFTLTAGGAYHYLRYDNFTNKAYLPEYQAFGGAELYIYWPQRLLHLYAYGELVYNSRYDGYDEKNLGDRVVANVKLSFRIKKFRFHYVIQNAFDQSLSYREHITYANRYVYYGLTWNFAD